MLVDYAGIVRYFHSHREIPMKAMRVAIGLMLAAGAAGCTSSSSPILPADASFNGGHTLGGGAREEEPSGQETTVTSESTGRGGHTLGSGG